MVMPARLIPMYSSVVVVSIFRLFPSPSPHALFRPTHDSTRAARRLFPSPCPHALFRPTHDSRRPPIPVAPLQTLTLKDFMEAVARHTPPIHNGGARQAYPTCSPRPRRLARRIIFDDTEVPRTTVAALAGPTTPAIHHREGKAAVIGSPRRRRVLRRILVGDTEVAPPPVGGQRATLASFLEKRRRRWPRFCRRSLAHSPTARLAHITRKRTPPPSPPRGGAGSGAPLWDLTPPPSPPRGGAGSAPPPLWDLTPPPSPSRGSTGSAPPPLWDLTPPSSPVLSPDHLALVIGNPFAGTNNPPPPHSDEAIRNAIMAAISAMAVGGFPPGPPEPEPAPAVKNPNDRYFNWELGDFSMAAALLCAIYGRWDVDQTAKWAEAKFPMQLLAIVLMVGFSSIGVGLMSSTVSWSSTIISGSAAVLARFSSGIAICAIIIMSGAPIAIWKTGISFTVIVAVLMLVIWVLDGHRGDIPAVANARDRAKTFIMSIRNFFKRADPEEAQAAGHQRATP